MGAINYTIDKSKNLVITDCSGTISLDEFKTVVGQLMADPNYGKGLHSITDITGSSMDATFNDIGNIRTVTRPMEETRGEYKWALVVDDRNDLEHVNLFKMLSMDGTAQIELFNSREEAEAWICG